jgi:phenylacetic acid degradation operon negative regulatory protein
VFVAEHRGGELLAMVRQAWDPHAIEQDYEDFIGEFDQPATRDPLAQLVQLVHAWRRFPTIDPELPTELLPEHWSGARAAIVFHQRHATWTARARMEWQRISG